MKECANSINISVWPCEKQMNTHTLLLKIVTHRVAMFCALCSNWNVLQESQVKSLDLSVGDSGS